MSHQVQADAIILRRLVAANAEEFVTLRRRALADSPLAFSAWPDHDRRSSVDVMRENLSGPSDAAIFGAFEGPLVGCVGVYREANPKLAHKAQIWGMYVMPDYRGRSIGRRLLLAALDHARSLPGVIQAHLTVSEAAPAARRLYESVGFRLWGSEPRALQHEGRFVTEYHLVLPLDVPCTLASEAMASRR